MDGSEKRSLLCSSELSFAFSAAYLITPGGPKKKTKKHKTGSFLLFGKIVKKLIIIGVSIKFYYKQWETILWWTEGIFLQKIRK